MHPVWAQHGMVASQEALATRIGVDMLQRGGNAVDAAVAVGFALAVTLPRAGNLGGGGFMVIHDAETGRDVAIDYRELAPKAAFRDQYLDAAGNPDPNLSRYHGLAVGVPGTVAGLALALETLRHAAAEGRDRPGHRARPRRHHRDARSRRLAARPPRSASPSGRARPRSSSSPTAATTSRATGCSRPISRHRCSSSPSRGRQAFYQGPLAQKIAAEVQAAGGNMSVDDLHAYRAIEREPVRGSYRGYDIVSMPPPSSGGVHVIQILNILEGFPIGWLGPQQCRDHPPDGRGDEARLSPTAASIWATPIRGGSGARA